MAAEDVIKVRRASSATKLASVIARRLNDGDDVVLKYIGAAACNQAVKAVIIAQDYIARGQETPFIPPRDWTLSMRGAFTDVDMPERTVTGMLLKVLVDK